MSSQKPTADSFYNAKYTISLHSKQFKILSDTEISSYVNDVWNEHYVSHSHHFQFINRTKQLILSELFEETKIFQSSVHKKYNQYQHKQIVFNLQLNARQSAGNQFLVKFTSKYKNQNKETNQRKKNNISNLCRTNKDKITLICCCSFEKRLNSNIVDIIQQRNHYMIDGEYLNVNKKENYIMVDIKSLLSIKAEDDEQSIREHIKKCNWTLIETNYPIQLYLWQIKHLNIFLNNINRNNNKLSDVQSLIINKSINDIKNNSNLNINMNTYKNLKHKIENVLRNNTLSFINAAQMESIIKSLYSSINIIHGPPGTGKTSTVSNLINIITLLSANSQIFVCAFTHNAVNELLRKIDKICRNLKDRIVRLGEMDKVPYDLREYCFQSKFQKTQHGFDEFNAFKSVDIVFGTVYSAAGDQLKEYIKHRGGKMFNYVIIDEVTQILDPVITIAVNMLNHHKDEHLVLIGDHLQLSPVIKSNINKEYKSMFECVVLNDIECRSKWYIYEYEECELKMVYGYIRSIERMIKNNNIPMVIYHECFGYHGKTKLFKSYYTLLNIQYRMCSELIMFSNKYFYNFRIKSYLQNVDYFDATTAKIFALMDIIRDKNLNDIDIIYFHPIPIFVVYCKNGKAMKENGSSSWRNKKEANFIINCLLETKQKYIPSLKGIGIISLYKSQKQYIYKLKGETFGYDNNDLDDVLIGTVHTFQGKEKPLIILSLCKHDLISNPQKFADSPNLVNVSLTRSQKAIVIVCSFNLQSIQNVSSPNSYWKNWFKDFINLNKN